MPSGELGRECADEKIDNVSTTPRSRVCHIDTAAHATEWKPNLSISPTTESEGEEVPSLKEWTYQNGEKWFDDGKKDAVSKLPLCAVKDIDAEDTWTPTLSTASTLTSLDWNSQIPPSGRRIFFHDEVEIQHEWQEGTWTRMPWMGIFALVGTIMCASKR
jgi:hypothetical protein